MSNPTTPAHDYVRPGQVHAHIPPPDGCVQCGEPESAPVHREPSYMSEADLQDRYLADKLIVIRRQFEAGEITEAEAASQRVAAYSHHLLAVADLSAEFFGE